jgi:hypothetical protein
MWNESARIEATVATLADAFADDVVEVIFVDDGSDDGTADIVERACKEAAFDAEVMRSPRTGARALPCGPVSSPPPETPSASSTPTSRPGQPRSSALFAAVDAGRGDVVPSRATADATITVRQPFTRRWSGWLFNLGLRAARLTRLTDTQCGLKAFRVEVVPSLFGPLVAAGFAFDVEVLARAERLGLVVTEVPVVWHHVDGSRLSPLRDGVATFREAWQVRRALNAEARRAPSPRR